MSAVVLVPAFEDYDLIHRAVPFHVRSWFPA